MKALKNIVFLHFLLITNLSPFIVKYRILMLNWGSNWYSNGKSDSFYALFLTQFIAQTYGIMPGYYMNKAHWISVILDCSVGDGKTLDFLDMSYDFTDTGRK